MGGSDYRGLVRAVGWSPFRRLPGYPAERRRPHEGRQPRPLGVEPSRVPVPAAPGPLSVARARRRAHHERDRSRLEGAHGASLRISAVDGARDLHGRAPASARQRAAHVVGLLDRQVGRQDAGRHDDALEGQLSPAQRGELQRQGDHDRVSDASWRLFCRGDDSHRSGVAGRAVRAEHALPARYTAAAGLLSVHRERGEHLDGCSALPAGTEPAPHGRRHSPRGGPGRR